MGFQEQLPSGHAGVCVAAERKFGTFQKDAKVVDSLFGETTVLPPEIALKLSTEI